MSRFSSYARLQVLAGLLVTIFWLAMMFTLVRDRVLPQRRAAQVAARSVSPATLTPDWRDVSEYMLVSFGGSPMGAAETSIRRVDGPAPAYVADLRVGLRPQIAGITQVATILARAELNQSFVLRRFHMQLDLGGFELKMTGRADDETLLLKTERSGETVLTKYTLPGPISLLEAVRPVATRSLKIQEGESIAVPVVDPVMSMQIGTMELRVREPETIMLRGREQSAYRVETRLGDFISTSWVDTSGTTLRRQLTGGFMLDAATSETARATVPDIFNERLLIPDLDESTFSGVTPHPITRLTDRSDSPLAILGTFAN